MARVGWPSLPAGVLVDEIRDWWDASRQEWSRRIHGFYRTLGRGVTWPVRAAWDAVAGPSPDPLAAFQSQERAAIVMAVEKLLDELSRLAQVGNDTLRPRLMRLLGGHARADLLARVQAAHENLPAIDEDYRRFLRAELDAWRDANPRAVRFLQSLDHAAALARPAITVALFFTGLHFAGDLVGQAAVHAAGATAGHLATEAAIAGGITGGGEALVSTTSEGVRQAAGRLFIRLQSRYAQQRARWLAEWLERELLGDLLADLRRGAEVPRGSGVPRSGSDCGIAQGIVEDRDAIIAQPQAAEIVGVRSRPSTRKKNADAFAAMTCDVLKHAISGRGRMASRRSAERTGGACGKGVHAHASYSSGRWKARKLALTSSSGKRVVENIDNVYDRAILLMLE